MLKKLLFVYAFLFSYSGAILHSIIPHHHHDSHKEAKSHHHHGSQSSHSHHDDKKDTSNHEHSGSVYFLTHAANSDITISHSSEQGITKVKKAEKQVTVYNLLVIANRVPPKQIFHPPSDDLFTHSSLYLFSALRAPPFPIV
jgi:hypothetical protein